MSERKGKPERWSDYLWKKYTEDYGESDKKYVKSCNRFLDAMLEHRLQETLTLLRALMGIIVLRRDLPLPKKYKGSLDSLALKHSEDINSKDEIDVYRHWYSEHIKWDKLEVCLCQKIERKDDDGFGRTMIEPWFLSACVDLAYSCLQGDISPHLEKSVSGEPSEIDEPILEDTDFMIKASQDLETYLVKGLWRIDEGGMEEIDIQTFRMPEESRKVYISRVLEMVDTYLLWGMETASDVTLRPKMKLKGTDIKAGSRHEEMLVRRMFGEPISSIVESMEKTLPEGDPKRETNRSIEFIAKHLGFLSVSEEESSDAIL
jgi:hypothetical protein|tara:strand:+ start:1192 stop:2145 length:954 start_codon:yes stop_codon:yes gene_type:complete